MKGLEKDVTLGKEARDRIIEGVDVLANAVKVTLGPKGRNVIIEGELFPRVTKDGVTVAKSIQLKHPIQNLGCTVIKQAAAKTNDSAGDGTTTSTVLAQALVQEGNKLVISGEDPVQVKRQMDESLLSIVDYLKKQSIKVKGDWKKVHSIATISANNDSKIGDIITEAFKVAGVDGVVSVDQSKTGQTYLEQVKGMELDNGYMSPYFVTNPEAMKAEYEDAYVLIYDGKIISPKGMEKILDAVARSGKPLLIIADEIDAQTLNLLVINKMRGGFKICATKSPRFGQMRKKILEDIAIMTGGHVFSEDHGLTIDLATLEHLGKVKKFISTSKSTTLIDGSGDPKNVESRIETLRSQIDLEETNWGKQQVKERIAKLSNGVAIIRVGAATDVEVGEIKDRIDDALKATRAALEEGILPGGGTALINAVSNLKSLDKGSQLLFKACLSPLKTIVNNAGKSGEAVTHQLLEMKKDGDKDALNIGYNAATETFVDMLKEGIIDPTKVVRVALENAVSVAGMILTTECSVTNPEQDSDYDTDLITP